MLKHRNIYLLPEQSVQRRHRQAVVCVVISVISLLAALILLQVEPHKLQLWTPQTGTEFTAVFLVVLAIWSAQAATLLFRAVNDFALVRAIQERPFFLGSIGQYPAVRFLNPLWRLVIAALTMASAVFFIRHLLLLI